MESPNKELIVLLKTQDPKGIELLYEYYASAVYGSVLRIVKNSSVADKIIQDCFIDIWKTFHTSDIKETELFMFIISLARQYANKSQKKAYLPNIVAMKYATRVYHTSSAWCMSSAAVY